MIKYIVFENTIESYLSDDTSNYMNVLFTNYCHGKREQVFSVSD